jgi:hypothetical protein
MALLKAKATETLGEVPSEMERIVFGECVRDEGKQSPAKYAKCLVKLFRARDNGKKKAMAMATTTTTTINSGQKEEGEEGLIGGTMVTINGCIDAL